MHDLEKIVIQYEEQAKADAKNLKGMFQNYNQENMIAMQKAERLKLSKKYADNGRWVIDKIDTRAQAIEKQIAQKKYPLVMSMLESERLRGSIDYSTGMNLSLSKIPVQEWRDAVATNRTDLAYVLGTRAINMKVSTPDQAEELARFGAEFNKWVESLGVPALETERKELASARKRAEFFVKQAEYDFQFDINTMEGFTKLLNTIRAQ